MCVCQGADTYADGAAVAEKLDHRVVVNVVGQAAQKEGAAALRLGAERLGAPASTGEPGNVGVSCAALAEERGRGVARRAYRLPEAE